MIPNRLVILKSSLTREKNKQYWKAKTSPRSNLMLKLKNTVQT